MANIPEIVPCAYLDKRNCKSVFIQLSQQKCLRSGQEKYLSEKKELKTMKTYLTGVEINIKFQHQGVDYFKEKTK